MADHIVCGLDLATHTGYSVWRARLKGAPDLLESGTICCNIATKSARTPDPEGKRFDLLRFSLVSIFERHKVIEVFHERTVGGPTAGGAPALISAGMTAILQQLAFASGLGCWSISTGTLKKHATGHGGHDTKKQHMIAAALHSFPKHVIGRRSPTKNKPWSYDDDETDALWAGHYGAYASVGGIYHPCACRLVNETTVEVTDLQGKHHTYSV